MFRPDLTDFYPLNENDQPDFGSILLTIDSNLIRPNDPHVVQKFVLSTESPAAALVSLLAYYDQPEQITQPATLEMLQESGRARHPIFVYFTPRPGVVEVLCSTQTHDMLVEEGAFGAGSLLLMGEKLTHTVASVAADLQRRYPNGEIPRLLVLDVSPAPKASDQQAGQEGPQPQEDVAGAQS